MAKSKKKLPDPNVLRYTQEKQSQGKVRLHYLAWRMEQSPPLPERCDNPECQFHKGPLVWNGKPLKLILDHIDGNNSDNRTKMLRLLCPNCDSQLPTRGGGNKGRIEKSAGGFAVVSGGKRNYVLPVETGHYTVTGGDAQLTVRKPQPPQP